VLVVGGGSGWFLEQLLLGADCSEVVYQDISPRMLSRAEERIRERLPGKLERVEFVQEGLTGLPLHAQFDAICTHCFLDLFSDDTLPEVVARLAALLEPGGIWYVSDFSRADGFPMAAVSRSLLWVMYRFFRLTCGIEASRLPDFDRAWESSGLEVTDERRFHGGMIRAYLLSRDEALSSQRNDTCL
jgi:SAM-dependent methyltransferase